jgi:outer membrane protein
VPTSDQEWAKVALGMNLNNQIAAKQLAMAREDIAIARSGHYPTLTFNAQYQYQDTGGIDATNASPQQMAMLTIPGSPLSNYTVGSAFMQLSIPLFAGGGVNAKTRQAMANYESAAQQQLSVNRGADQNIRNAFWQVQNGVSLVKAQKAALLSAKTKLDSDQLGYQVGVRNSVDLVNAQKNYYQTYQTYQQARYQYLLAAIQLRYLSGQITPKYLQEINANIQN